MPEFIARRDIPCKAVLQPLYDKRLVAEMREVGTIQEAAHLMNTGEWLVTETCGSDDNGWKLILVRLDPSRRASASMMGQAERRDVRARL